MTSFVQCETRKRWLFKGFLFSFPFYSGTKQSLGKRIWSFAWIQIL